MEQTRKTPIIVRGAGDISTGTIHRLVSAGFSVLALESERPSAIRRLAAFSEAIYDGKATVEGITAVKAETLQEALNLCETGQLPVLVDHRHPRRWRAAPRRRARSQRCSCAP